MTGRHGGALRAALAGLCLWAAFGSGGAFLLERLLPAQRAVYAALMPDFELRSFELQTRSAQLKLRAVTQSRNYLVMAGRAHEPGIEFDVETPARTALLYAVLIVVGALFAAPAGRRVGARATLFALSAAGLMAIVPLPLILAGEQWGLGVRAGAEPSLPALLVACSGFLIHGGGVALCAAIVWALSAWSRSCSKRSGCSPNGCAAPF